jgi:hypothetical protein
MAVPSSAMLAFLRSSGTGHSRPNDRYIFKGGYALPVEQDIEEELCVDERLQVDNSIFNHTRHDHREVGGPLPVPDNALSDRTFVGTYGAALTTL